MSMMMMLGGDLCASFSMKVLSWTVEIACHDGNG